MCIVELEGGGRKGNLRRSKTEGLIQHDINRIMTPEN